MTKFLQLALVLFSMNAFAGGGGCGHDEDDPCREPDPQEILWTCKIASYTVSSDRPDGESDTFKVAREYQDHYLYDGNDKIKLAGDRTNGKILFVKTDDSRGGAGYMGVFGYNSLQDPTRYSMRVSWSSGLGSYPLVDQVSIEMGEGTTNRPFEVIWDYVPANLAPVQRVVTGAGEMSCEKSYSGSIYYHP